MEVKTEMVSARDTEAVTVVVSETETETETETGQC